MKEIETPKLNLDLSKSKRKESQIEAAVNSVGSLNHKFGVMKPCKSDLLKRNKLAKFNIDLD